MSDEDLTGETQEVLRRARLGEPMPVRHKRRLKSAVLARIALASTTLAAGQATATGLFGAAAKTVMAIAVVGSLGTGSYLALRAVRHRVEPAARAVVAPPAEKAVPAPSIVESSAPPPPSHSIAHRAPTPARDLAAETKLLRAADRALRDGDTTAAAARLDDHAARFPNGALAPERTAEQLIVACEVGGADRTRVDRFLAAHASSPFAARVRRACAAVPINR
jgi:hypothetical protein